MGGRWVRLEGRPADDDAAVHRDGWAPAWSRASTLRLWLHWICILLRPLSYLKEPPDSQFPQPQSSKSRLHAVDQLLTQGRARSAILRSGSALTLAPPYTLNEIAASGRVCTHPATYLPQMRKGRGFGQMNSTKTTSQANCLILPRYFQVMALITCIVW